MALGFVVLGTLFAAIAGGIITASAFSSRYAAVVFLPFLLLIALGTTTLLNPRVRVVVVGLAVVAGLVSSAQNVTTQRTQAGAVAAALNAYAKPGDVIAFCPDQLGPGGLPADPGPLAVRHDHLPAPDAARQIVDWVDYADTVHAADPNALRRRRLPDDRAAGQRPATASGWSGSPCTRPTASSARRSPPTS